MSTGDLDAVRGALRRFVAARDWDRFHRPKDLALSVSLEAAELLEIFQWRDPEAADLSAEDRARIEGEIADVVLYALLLADKTGIDLLEALTRKLAVNETRYPADRVMGRAVKHDRL